MFFEFLNPSNIKVDGYMKKQLETQANGLNGNLDKVWRDVRDTKWLGGDGEGWERFPYFLDGFIPLAYLLNDADKIARAKKYANALIKAQKPSGRFDPEKEDSQNNDIWSQFLILKVLTVYADCSGDESVVTVVYNGLKYISKSILSKTPDNWACSRWFECIIPIIWLYNKVKEDWLIKLAVRLKAYGLDYGTALKLWNVPSNEWCYENHVVNIAMALKSEAVYCEITGEKPSGLAENMLDVLFKYHGTCYGHFNGDECLSGNEPIRGSELCGIVEAMYSYEWLTAITGDAKWGDNLEKLAFNGLPATISTDMWTHQYDQQVNQIACVPFKVKPFITNNNEANLFGLEPHYGCCTSNFGQGFPKFCLSAYMKKGNGLAVISPIPATVKVGNVSVKITSQYPFRSKFTMVSNGDIKIYIRIPNWTEPKISTDYVLENGYAIINAKNGEEIVVDFPATPKLSKTSSGNTCLNYGALLFALPISYKRKMNEYVKDNVERKFPYCDYEFTPTSEWRYAFAGDDFKVIECDYNLPFDRENPPLKIEGEFALVNWNYEKDMELVASIKPSNERIGENVTLKMQPYGATYLRITEMAKIK